MSYEAPPNSFRASLRREPGQSPIVTAKKPRADRGTEGLEAVAVPRSEGRRTNHRGGDRHQLQNEQVAVRVDRRTFEVELINLSRGGAMIEGGFKAKLWDRLELVLGPRGVVECAVRWVRGNRYGLEFARETRIECDPATMNAAFCDVIRNSFAEHEAELGADADASEQPSEPNNTPRTAVSHPLI